MSNVWDKYLDPRDAEVYSSAGLGKSYGFGNKVALLIIDMMVGFTGDKPEPIEESIKKFPFSSGEVSWPAIRNIKRILSKVREKDLPVFYAKMQGSRTTSNEKMGMKGNFWSHPAMLEGEKGTQIVDEISPIDGEYVFDKYKPSAFFGTPLLSYLTAHNVDTLIVTGCVTSGCIRASVVDAFSYNYNVIVPEECVFDRGITTHAINLFDMQFKYADVLSTDEVIKSVEELY